MDFLLRTGWKPVPQSIGRVRARGWVCAALLGALLGGSGCSQLIDPNVPEPIRPMIEPVSGRAYLLYRPSSYDRRYAWPLVVVCHTTLGDSPIRAIRDWTQLAELHRFLVAAPTLESSAEYLAPKAKKQIPLLEADERHILAVVRHLRGGYNISEDRIFIHGWSGGAFAALFAGLKNPETFRAMSLIEPRFEASYFVKPAEQIDSYQPVWVHYSSSDALTGRQARICAEWLREHGGAVHEDPYGPARRSDTDRAVEFYETVIRKIPWLHVRALPVSAERPLGVQFKLRSSFEPARAFWDFGDAGTAAGLEPVHVYTEAGSYEVAVTVEGSNGGEVQRRRQIVVPVGPR